MANRTYDRMAPMYEWLTDVYSFGCVPRAKRRQLDHIEEGMRVLYVGVGPGSDALAAAEAGADVTAIDLSERMIEIASRRIVAAGRHADLRCSDLFEFEPEEPYHVVVANFLVDCFDDDTRPRVVARLGGFLHPGGKILICDTGIPRGSWAGRAFWRIYHGIAYSTTYVQGLTTWLPIMDLSAYLRGAGCTVEDQVFDRGWRGGPVLFESVVGIKT
jgi:ubiquinone/menaquinone biosynthesis C-methylase UbiE